MTSHQLDDFPSHTFDKVRYGDTDRQGHVNNAVFSTYLETGRVHVLHSPGQHFADSGCEFVIAHLSLDYLSELHWPGTVEIGTRVGTFGRSSVTLEQALFQHGQCAAFAKSVVVQIDTSTRQSRALSDEARARLQALVKPEQA